MTIGTIRTKGANKITASVGDIQNIIPNAVAKVMTKRIRLVLASEIISSN